MKSGEKIMTTVMVIEPDVLIRAPISESLRACGYRVIEGVSAADLWAVMGSNTIVNVVMVDARLPGAMNGFELAHQLRQTHESIDVILTSGFSDAAEKSSHLCERRRANPNAPDPK
jgi:CheY-like chemotaxis protein